MSGLTFTIDAADLPAPGEIVELDQGGYVLLIENPEPPTSEVDEEPEVVTSLARGPVVGALVRYVPVDITAPASVVRHATRVYQRKHRTRVARYTLCDRSRQWPVGWSTSRCATSPACSADVFWCKRVCWSKRFGRMGTGRGAVPANSIHVLTAIDTTENGRKGDFEMARKTSSRTYGCGWQSS